MENDDDPKAPAVEIKNPVNESDDKKELVNNEFSYLDRPEFTSEIYKIEVRNLGYFGIGEFKKLLKSKLQLDTSKIKSPKRKDFAFVCFRSKEDQERAVQTLNGYKWKGKELKACIAKASADPLMKRRNEEQENDEAKNEISAKRQKIDAAAATCPLACLPYEQQLVQKTEKIELLIKGFTNELRRKNANAKIALDAFKFEGVLPSPLVNGYRNKNEFTVGKNTAGEIVVGFRLGSYAHNSVEVAEVQALPHLPASAKWAASSFEKFMRSSKYVPFNPEENTGHIRQVMVRTSSHTGEIMIVAGAYSTNLSPETLAEFKNDLITFYGNPVTPEDNFKCTSLYYQDVRRRTAGEVISPVEHLWGSTHIEDVIQNLKFRISPLAFFQINTASANVLYQKAIELAAPKLHTTVLDICCGTGTIALAFSRHCKRVLGVEIVPDAIKDAEFNAIANEIKNCKFYAGNADDYIQSMVREVVYDNVAGEPLDLIAIVDPPRAGLHNRSIAAIRAASAIKRLVYISCNPTSAKRNWIELGRPESKQYKGDPFYPRSAVAVDMFPHTTHMELVILFERGNSSDVREQINEGDAKLVSILEKETPDVISAVAEEADAKVNV